MQRELFFATKTRVALGDGAVLLGGFALDCASLLVAEIDTMAKASPFRHLETPGGRKMSVAMFNGGPLGWVSDRTGYRYSPVDPLTGKAWPPLSPAFKELAAKAATAAGYAFFVPDACLVNRYVVGAKLSLHQDMDEHDLATPIVSVSLGLPAKFVWGGLHRGASVQRHRLVHGDVVVWGGPSRLVFHGVDTLKAGDHPATGAVRYNLTFRKVRKGVRP